MAWNAAHLRAFVIGSSIRVKSIRDGSIRRNTEALGRLFASDAKKSESLAIPAFSLADRRSGMTGDFCPIAVTSEWGCDVGASHRRKRRKASKPSRDIKPAGDPFLQEAIFSSFLSRVSSLRNNRRVGSPRVASGTRGECPNVAADVSGSKVAQFFLQFLPQAISARPSAFSASLPLRAFGRTPKKASYCTNEINFHAQKIETTSAASSGSVASLTVTTPQVIVFKKQNTLAPNPLRLGACVAFLRRISAWLTLDLVDLS
ncbi:hypothetical protein [uncultured Rhodoblastus sp.]|uniref:hypothetical protein n=1 Tax=uncultured Rhodoblastus sp. TaxID=543037 RepID=UPI0025FB01FE|nr:hypothetical protein [uncultured Rhodoblastus sp.]